MKRIINIVIFITFISTFSFSCDCRNLRPLENVRQLSYENSEIVFLGELIDINKKNQTYTFRIIELFKGKYKESIIKGKYFDSCSAFPTDKCRWIVYANFKENNKINISSCYASRSEKNPFCSNCYDVPVPPKAHMTKSEKEIRKKEVKEFSIQAKLDWENEIVMLRQGLIK